MRAAFLLTSFLALAVACTPSAEKSRADSDSVVIPPPPIFETTALAVLPIGFPAPFHLDSLLIRDTATNLTAQLFFPVSAGPEWETLNGLALALVKSKTEGYGTPGEKYEYITIDVWPSGFSRDSDFVSICFTAQSYSYGAAHYHHTYSALNVDRGKGRQVFLRDIFRLPSQKAKQEFCDSVNGGPEDSAPYYERLDSHTPILEPGDLRPDMDFMIGNGTITFLFDDYEKGPSMTEVTVQLAVLSRFLRPEYRFLLG